MSKRRDRRKGGLTAPALLGFAVALFLVNGLLTYANAWPTPWISLRPRLSSDLAFLLLAIAVLAHRGDVRGLWRSLLALVLVVLFIGHYSDVTTEGLFGKPIDVYWDLAHLPNATVMLADSAPVLLVAVAAGSAAFLIVLFLGSRWVIGALAAPMANGAVRTCIGGVAIAVLLAFAAGVPVFARPGSSMVAEQARLVWINATESRKTTSSTLPQFQGGTGSDVFIFFFESYAGSAFADPVISGRVAPALQRLSDQLEQSGWAVASALLASPTFGGASWLAHASVLSGQTIENQRAYNGFLEQPPITLIDRFADAGYRTAALMPGLIDPWPEGESLGFDAIYPRRTIDYRGPGFGFWHVPDQASLAWFAQTEMERPGRAPLFVIFPTVVSHIPFSPVPPVIQDWSIIGTGDTFAAQTVRTNAARNGWFDYRTPYAEAVSYNLDIVGGFLESVAREDSLVIAMGDHPPPAIVGGPNGDWTVPVHVFSRDAARLESFHQAGFVRSLAPGSTPVGDMAEIPFLLLATDLTHVGDR